MSDFVEDTEAFARLVDALRPWIEQVVFVGGWASRLYRLHPLALALEHEPLATFDADVAVPEQLKAEQESICRFYSPLLSGFLTHVCQVQTSSP